MPCLSGDTQLDGTTELFEVDQEETVQDQSEGNDCRASKATTKHTKNFVNKNIEVCQSSCWAKGGVWIYPISPSKSRNYLFFQ